MDFIIVSGMSGSGKSIALHALEDLGYYCIDNLPAVLLPQLSDYLGQYTEGLSDRAEAAAELPGRFRLQHAGGKPAGRRQRQSAHRHARGNGRHADRGSEEHEQLPGGRAGAGLRSPSAVRPLATDLTERERSEPIR